MTNMHMPTKNKPPFWMQKLTILLGRPPIMEGVDYNARVLDLPNREASAKNLFMGLIANPEELKKAKKLGLV